MADQNDEREAKRKRQRKKWGKFTPFLFSEASSGNTNIPMDLTTMGKFLEAEVYSNGKKGWEKFAIDLGAMYNSHIKRQGFPQRFQKRLNDVKKQKMIL